MPAGSIYWIEKDMMGDTLINTRCSHLEEEMDYAYFEIRSYFIHSVHPLGFFRKVEVSIDDRKISTDDIFFVVRGNWIPVRYMHTISDIWWNQSESAYIYIRKPGGFVPGVHKVDLYMNLQSLFNTKTLDTKGISVPMPMHLTKDVITKEAIAKEDKR